MSETEQPSAALSLATIEKIVRAANARTALSPETMEGLRGWLSNALANTSGGRKQRYFLAQPGAVYPSSHGAGVDVQSGNKYAMAPRSRHHRGRRYCWQEGCHQANGATFLTHIPDRLLKRPHHLHLLAMVFGTRISQIGPNRQGSISAQAMEAWAVLADAKAASTNFFFGELL